MAARPRRRAIYPGFDVARAVLLIITDWEDFLSRAQGEEPGDSKAFAGRHAAGRAALTHAEHVMKIAAMVGADSEGDDLASLLAEARAQVNDDPNEETDADDSAAGGTG
jgi:hypothetical protein